MISNVLTVLLLSLFILLPIALVSFHRVGRVAATSIVLAFYLLSCVFVQVIRRSLEVQLS